MFEKNDTEYFEQIIDAFAMLNSFQDGVAFIKDKDLNTLVATKKVLDWAQVNTPEEFNSWRKMTLDGEDCPQKKLMQKANSQYLEILTTGNPKKTLDIVKVDNHLVIDIWILTPIINPTSKNILGIYAIATEFIYPHLLRLLLKLNNTPIELNEVAAEHKLTERQQMILFLYLHRFSNTEISTYMTTIGYKISAGRVNEHLRNLKVIFGASNKEQLLDIALKYNYDKKIPEGFLHENTIEI